MWWPGSSPSGVPCPAGRRRGCPDEARARGRGPAREGGRLNMCPGHDSLPPSTASPSSRRGFLFKLGLGLNALGAVLVGIPVVGYILAPARKASAQSWIKLGTVTNYPEGETRLAIYDNPFRVPWDGATAKVACWVRRIAAD